MCAFLKKMFVQKNILGWREVCSMSRMKNFIKKEMVLSIAILLAVISAFLVLPDRQYLDYIDFRTLGILFSLMAVVAGLRQLGLFDWFAGRLLQRVHGIGAITTVLILLCFFSSMLITNDVSLITFVPFTIVLAHKMPTIITEKWLLRIVVMQTIAANLGSMLTPIGNPQNLYLYGKTEMSVADFINLLLPYTVAALVLLLGWIAICAWRDRKQAIVDPDDRMENQRGKLAAVKNDAENKQISGNDIQNIQLNWKLIGYIMLFAFSLLVVARMISYGILVGVVLLYIVLCDRKILGEVDYSLLATFVALFIFIGNIGRIDVFHDWLQHIITGREVITSVLASQVMSNVPAAILLSGFTENIQALIIGTNLGGLGTLIASMASLISFKYIAKENVTLRGRYFLSFTIANVVFLVVMLMFNLK